METRVGVAADVVSSGPSSTVAGPAETEGDSEAVQFAASDPLNTFLEHSGSAADAGDLWRQAQSLDLLTGDCVEKPNGMEADVVDEPLRSTDQQENPASVATAQVYEQKMQEMKAQIDDLWSQKEAFRRANERITRILTQLQQHGPKAAADLNAAAAEAVRSARGNPGSLTHRLLLRSPREVPGGTSDYPSARVTTTGDSGPRRRGSASSMHLPRSQSVTVRTGRESRPLREGPVPRLHLQGSSPQKGGSSSSPIESYRGSRVRASDDLMRYRADNPRGREERTLHCDAKHECSSDGRKKGHQLPPLPLRSGPGSSTGSREGMRPSTVRSASQHAASSRLRRLESAGLSALPPLPSQRRRSLQFGHGLASARSRSGSGTALPLTARPSLAETALRTPRRCFLDDGIVCVSNPSGSGSTERSPLGSPLGIAAAPMDFGALQGAGSQCEGGGGVLGGLEEHLAASVRQALETLQRVENGGNHGILGSTSAAALVAAGTAGGAMSCVQKPTDGYWHIMYTCVIKIRGTDFFLNVRCGDDGPRNGRLIATKEQAGIFKVCVRHLLRGARDMYDAWKVFWWHPMPVILVEELLPLDEVLRRRAEERLQQLKKNRKKRNKKKKRGKSSSPAHSSSTERLSETLRSLDSAKTDSKTENFSASSSPSRLGALSRTNSSASLPKFGVSSSGRSSSRDDTELATATEVQSASDSEKTRKSGHRADYSEWDALALMYIGSLDAEAPICQFKSLHARQHSSDEGWYVSNSRAAVASGGNGSSASGTSEGAKTGSNRAERRRSTSSLAGFVEGFQESPAGAFDRACQLSLNNKLSQHEIFIVRRGDRERGCFPLYHRSARRYLYAHQTNGLVGMISARSTPAAAAAARAVRLALSKRSSSKNSGAAPNNEEEAGTETRPLLEAEPGEGEPRARPRDPNARQVLTPSQFELVALSDLMVQQTVAQILAALPPPESPLGHGDDYDFDDLRREEQLYGGSPPTTVSSDDAEVCLGAETSRASPSVCSSDEAGQDLVRGASSADLGLASSSDSLPADVSLDPCGTEAASDAGIRQGTGSVRCRPKGVPSLQLGAVPGVALERKSSQSSRTGWQSGNEDEACQSCEAPAGCHQFLLEEWDAETDLEEAASGEPRTPCAEEA